MGTAGERTCAVILAFVFPPLGVLMLRGCGKDLLINILLTILLLWFGGMVHAVWIAVSDAGRADAAGVQQPGLPVAQPYPPPPEVHQPAYPSGAPQQAVPYPPAQTPPLSSGGGAPPGAGAAPAVGPYGYPQLPQAGPGGGQPLPTMPAKQV